MARTSTLLAAFVLLSLLIAACSTTEEGKFSLHGSVYSVSDIAGTWQATAAQFSRAVAEPALLVDIVEQGALVVLTIESDGDFTLSISGAPNGSEVSTGRLGFDEDLLVISFDDAPDDWEYYGISATDVSLTVSGPAEYDFEGDGSEEPANVTFEFERDAVS